MNQAYSMKSRMENVFDSISDMMFLQEERGKILNLDLSAETLSTEGSFDDRELSFSTSGGDSSAYLPSPPRITKSHFDSRAHSAFSSIKPATPFSTTNACLNKGIQSSSVFDSHAIVASDSYTSIDDSSNLESVIPAVAESGDDFMANTPAVDVEVMGRSTPMARMRSVAIALASQSDTIAFVSPPRKSQIDPEKTMAKKHRKWRRQMKEAKRVKDEEKRMQEEAQEDNNFCVLNLLKGGRGEPARLFNQLTTMRCGGIQDVLSGNFSGEFSDTSSDGETNSVMSPEPARKKMSSCRKREKRMEWHRHAKENVMDGDDNIVSHSSPQSSTSHRGVNDINFIKAFIQEASQEGFPFIWHTPSQNWSNFENPIDIVAFLELGFLQENGHYAGPRLAWYSESGEALGAIDLLDIRSIEQGTPLGLHNFPFAVPGNSMIVKFQNFIDDLVLEASSTLDSRRFVYGLRWMVARLAFNLIVGNKDVSCELLELQGSPRKSLSRDRSKGMDDMTKQLIEKASFSSRQQLV